MQITKEIAQKVIDTVSQGLCKGLGKPEPGKMCVEAAVCYALGLEHGDEPTCVSPALRSVEIGLNDANWSSDQARANGMKRLAVLQLGTNKNFDKKEFIDRLVKMTIGTVVPSALRHAAHVHSEQKHKDALEKAAQECEKKKDNAAAYAARAAADAARATHAAADAAYEAADAAAYAAADAARAARAAADAACDKELLKFAQGLEQILIDMEVPGVQWLELIEGQSE